MEIMRCTVRRQLLDVDVPTLVALTYDYINVKATFSSEWAGMQKWLHIRNVENQSIIAHVLFNNDEIGEDVGLNLSAGEWDVWIHGALYEDNTLIKRITTNVKKIKVEPTGTQDEILPSIGPSVAEQAVAAAERAEAAADDAEDSADRAGNYADLASTEATNAQTAAANALGYVNICANYAAGASNSASSALTYAQRAEAAVLKYPRIDETTKTWIVWMADASQWVDTGVVAEGGTFTPSVDEYGVLSWTNNAGLPNPAPVNIVSLFNDVPELQARMDEILAEAEAGVADIEEQRDTILASIAAAAQLGTDTTLTTAGMAADAKATGDAIDALKDYQSAAFFSRTTSFTGVNYKKIDDFHLEIYGTSTASSTRFVNLLNGSAQLLTTTATPTKIIPAGTYKFKVQFTGHNSAGQMYIIPNTTARDTILIVDGAIVEMQSPFTIGIRVPSGSDWGTSSAPTYLHFEAKSIGAKDQYTLYPTGDQSDRSADIMTTLKSFGKCVLAKGEYIVNDMQMPSYTTLEGCGRSTILRPPTGATGAVIKLERGCAVKDLKIIGLSGESYEPDQSTIGVNHGISANGISGSDYTDRLRLIIEAVEIAGFDGAGIYLYNTGGNINDGASICDCCVHNCEVGLYTKSSEYHRVSNSSFTACYYGTFNDGSNNVFSNCGFNGCAIGAYLENVDGTVGNHAAGTFSSCTFHHSHSTAIKIEGAGDNYVSQGEIFIGCEIGFGSVEITNGQGIHFSSCSFFNSVPISISDEGTNPTHTFVLFSSCLFRNATENPITKTGTATVLFENCHLRSTGGAFNPST